ncbi:hypothetical protein ACEQUB_00022 [Ralstonia syzygii]|nr:hypothetical protein LMG10661_01568 [Ralstonia syzygii subsp. syzygii]
MTVVTRLSIDRLHAQCSDAEIAELSFAIVVISNWNLLNVSLRNPVPETP